MEDHERQNEEVHQQQLTLKLASLDLYSIDIRREKQVSIKIYSRGKQVSVNICREKQVSAKGFYSVSHHGLNIFS
jgi:hypothetical protein